MLKIKILSITYKIVTDKYAKNKMLPITFEIGTNEYVENKNLVDYF